MSKVTRYDNWAAKNRRDRGVNDVQLDINLGGGNMLGVTGGKEKEYIELRAKVTNSTLIRMKELLNICRSELEFFSRLDDDNIPLTYLVALGITTEENISSYQIMRKRGIDTYRIQEQAIGKSIDSAYMREIKALEKEVPPLLNAKGENIERILTYELEKPVWAVDANHKAQEEPVKENEKQSVGGISEYTVSLDDAMEEVEESITAEKANSLQETDWRNILNSVKANTEKAEQGVEDVELPQDTGKRNVYIIANEFEVAYSDNYNFVFVNNTKSLGLFASNRNNLLVVTKDVPKFLMDEFVKWLRGMLRSEDKFRITTLRGVAMYADYIQEELYDLSDDSLDAFYEKHKNDEYIGDGVGSFYDLTSALEED